MLDEVEVAALQIPPPKFATQSIQIPDPRLRSKFTYSGNEKTELFHLDPAVATGVVSGFQLVQQTGNAVWKFIGWLNVFLVSYSSMKAVHNKCMCMSVSVCQCVSRQWISVGGRLVGVSPPPLSFSLPPNLVF